MCNTAKQCRLGLFQDSDLAGDLEDSKSTSAGTLCIFGSHTFVPISWMCKKQTSVSHSSTESEMMSLDAGLRMDGNPALDLWDLVIEVFHSSPNHLKDQVQGNLSRDTTSNKHTQDKTRVPTQHDNFDLNNVDCVPSNKNVSRFGAMLYIFEDNEAVIKMSIPALDLWDLIVAVLGNTSQSHKERGDPFTNQREVRSTLYNIQKRKQSQGVVNDLDNVDFIPSNVNSSHQEALLYVFEDNEAVIKMIIKGRSPTTRHVSRTHRVALDWFFDRINLDPKIQIKYIDTKNQLADILTKGKFHT